MCEISLKFPVWNVEIYQHIPQFDIFNMLLYKYSICTKKSLSYFTFCKKILRHIAECFKFNLSKIGSVNTYATSYMNMFLVSVLYFCSTFYLHNHTNVSIYLLIHIFLNR